jgi:hypothetical protein
MAHFLEKASRRKIIIRIFAKKSFKLCSFSLQDTIGCGEIDSQAGSVWQSRGFKSILRVTGCNIAISEE